LLCGRYCYILFPPAVTAQCSLHNVACKTWPFSQELLKELCRKKKKICFAFGLLCSAKLVNNNVLLGMVQYLL
jgi:hypothetical protein